MGESVEVGVAAHAREFLGVAVDELHVAEGFEVDGIDGLVVAVGALCWARRRRCGVHVWLYLYTSCCFEWEDKRDWTKWPPGLLKEGRGGGEPVWLHGVTVWMSALENLQHGDDGGGGDDACTRGAQGVPPALFLRRGVREGARDSRDACPPWSSPPSPVFARMGQGP